MNIYFLAEGRRTEARVYPAWLSYLIPELQRVSSPDEAKHKNYFFISAEGYPSIIHRHIPNSIADIKATGKYDYFVICLDADEVSVQERQDEIYQFLNTENIELGNTNLVLIIQNRCIETWFLGNRRVCPRHPQNLTLVGYTQYYNVSIRDPELMGKHHFEQHSHFHLAYLKEIFAERSLSYSKRRPGHVLDEPYLNQLLSRIKDEPSHLTTFRYFVEFCRMIRKSLAHSH